MIGRRPNDQFNIKSRICVEYFNENDQILKLDLASFV